MKAYNGANITALGACDVNVRFKSQDKSITFLIIKDGGPPLLGRNFLKTFGIEFSNLNYAEQINSQNGLLEKYGNLFDGTLGLFKKSQAHLHLKEGTYPKFFRPRPLPLAIKKKVEAELDNLVALKVLEPVDFSDWGTPIVPILKKDGGIRICGDFKVTLNPHLNIERYPLPRVEEIFAKLHGGAEFVKLDLSTAYQQIALDKESRKLTTISTSKGLFQYTRLIYGLASAPAIFQKIMDSVLMGLEGVVVFLDDILITAPNRKGLLDRVDRVLKLLSNAGFKLSKDKCEFFCKSITYLGHVIDSRGLHMNPEKVKDIMEMKHPTNIKELQAF